MYSIAKYTAPPTAFAIPLHICYSRRPASDGIMEWVGTKCKCQLFFGWYRMYLLPIMPILANTNRIP